MSKKNQVVKMLQNCAHGSSICKQSQGNYSLKLKNLFEDHSSALCTRPVISDYILGGTWSIIAYRIVQELMQLIINT